MAVSASTGEIRVLKGEEKKQKIDSEGFVDYCFSPDTHQGMKEKDKLYVG